MNSTTQLSLEKPSMKTKPSIIFEDPQQITFDNIKGEHNYRECSFLNILSYFFLIFGIVLQLLFLGSDVLTLIQIYALKNWNSSHTITYIPILAYKIVFTVCIGISFLYFIFFWILGAIIQHRNKIVSSYLHSGARHIDSIRNFERFCIYEKIQSKNLREWLCLSIYTSYHYDLINWILADSPRQILNGATIAFVVSNQFTSGNLKAVISEIAQNDKKEAVLLSFMVFSFVVWLAFTCKNIIIILSSICIISTSKRKYNKKFNNYCFDLVAQRVSQLYETKAQLVEKEQSKRRKVPSFLKNPDLDKEFSELDEFNYDDIPMNDTFNNSLNNSTNNPFEKSYNYNMNESIVSLDKSDHVKIELTDLPMSHSRVNLVNKSIPNIRNNSDFDHSNNNYNNTETNYNSSYNVDENIVNPFMNEQLVDNSNRDSYTYIPSKVYDEAYHQMKDPMLSSDRYENRPPIDFYENKPSNEKYNDSEDIEDSFDSKTNLQESNQLYGSRGLTFKRDIV